MLHDFMHSKSIFLGACVVTWVMYLLSLVLCQSLLYGSCVSLLENLHSHEINWTSWSFSFFWWTFKILEHMYLQIYLLVYLYSHWVHSCWSSFLISTFTWSYHKVPTGNKDSNMLTGISDVGSWQNYQSLNKSSFSPQDGFPKSPISH